MKTGTITLLADQAIKIDSIILHKNGIDTTGLSIGNTVDYEEAGEKLTYIRKAMAPVEHKTGGGKIIEISPTALAYEFSWKKEGVPTTSTSKFTDFTEVAKSKLNQFKIGDLVTVHYYKQNGKLVAEDIEPKQVKPFSGFTGSKPKSPEERRSIELQSTFRTVADVYIAALQNSGSPTSKTFKEMMQVIREEALISANWIRDHSKEVQ